MIKRSIDWSAMIYQNDILVNEKTTQKTIYIFVDFSTYLCHNNACKGNAIFEKLRKPDAVFYSI